MYARNFRCSVASPLIFIAAPVLYVAEERSPLYSDGETPARIFHSRSDASGSPVQEATGRPQAYFDGLSASGDIHEFRIRMGFKNDGYQPEPALSNTNDPITRDHVLFLFNYDGMSFVKAGESWRDWDSSFGVKLSFSPEKHQTLCSVWIAASQLEKWISVGVLVDGVYEECSR